MKKNSIYVFLILILVSSTSGFQLIDSETIVLGTFKISSPETDPYHIGSGLIRYETNSSWFNAENPDTKDIEFLIEFKEQENIVIDSNADNDIYFDFESSYYDVFSYQKKDNLTHFPDRFEVHYLYSNGDLKEAESELDYEWNFHMDKTTGEILGVYVPHAAYSIGITAIYDDYEFYDLYSSIMLYGDMIGITSRSDIVDPAVDLWLLGEEVREGYYTFNDYGSKDGFDTKIAQGDEPTGYDEYESVMEYEIQSGLLVSRNYVKVYNYTAFNFNKEIITLSQIIDDGYPQITVPEGILADKKTEEVALNFVVEDNHFRKLTFLRENIPETLATNNLVNWTFKVEPTEERVYYYLEVVDTASNEITVSTWVQIDPNSASGFGIGLSLFSVIIVILKKRKKKSIN